MKKLILAIPLFFITVSCFCQTIPHALVYLSTVSDLRLQTPQASEVINLMGLSSATDQNGGVYNWNPTSTATDDGFLTIQVTGISTGRWLRVGNGNTIKGTVSSTGIALTFSYTVNYQQGTLPFVPITVLIIGRSAAASGPNYISSITNTGFTVVFTGVPIGTITFDYIVIKQ